MLIINADDFGASEEINNAIARAFKDKLISSTTILANGPEFEQACALAKKNGFADKVGIHLNITEGVPLSAAMRGSKIFCNAAGMFSFLRFTHIILPMKELALLLDEFSAQIERCKLNGLQLTHADSHHHVHTELLIGITAMKALRRYNIPYMRLSDNVHRTSFPRKIYKSGFNFLLRLHGLRGTHYFCDMTYVGSVKESCDAPDHVVELMVHPALASDGEVVDALSRKPISASVQSIGYLRDLISFADIKSNRGSTVFPSST